ncbi:DUF418 domain-containing protein [Paenibacillus sp. YYML68]|uniref:DUF418 domain-containing protein n=1 Tax=Paenibacillus sp. YYML68 TaxID=2909250 RepID=UPI002490C209|nr:DUF418 domain-containing protein [Paenibacillus sp. YYML68]
MQINSPASIRRVEEVDLLRGFALLGICVANVPEMIGNGISFIPSYSGVDASIRLAIDLLVQTKFYTLFSFLFGLSFYLFMRRAEERGATGHRSMVRRLLLLLGIGLAHLIFIWYGDVLHLYAICGFALFLFYKRSPRTILGFGIGLLGWSMLIYVLLKILALLLDPAEMMKPLFDAVPNLRGRLQFIMDYTAIELFIRAPEIIGLMLLGIYAGVRGWLEPGKLSTKLLRRWQWGSFAVTVLLSIPIVHSWWSSASYAPNLLSHYTYLSGKSLAIFYVCTLLLIFRRLGTRRFTALQSMGRMAFTVYLGQSIVTVLLLAVWPAMSEWTSLATLVYSCLLLTIQLLLSELWLRRYTMGPLEWVWRAGTYGTILPLKRRLMEGNGR